MIREENSLQVSANFAITADGKINRAVNAPSVFTSKLDLERLIHLRKKVDAILVGRTTLEADQMTLTIPGLEQTKQPKRVIVSQSGDFDFSHPLFITSGGPIILISQTPRPSGLTSSIEWFQGSLNEFIDNCDAFEIKTLHCEGGAQVLNSLLEQNRIDCLYLTLNPAILFGNQEALTLIGLTSLSESKSLTLQAVEPNEAGELFLTYTLD